MSGWPPHCSKQGEWGLVLIQFVLFYFIFLVLWLIIGSQFPSKKKKKKDHVASCLEERDRVVKAGGQVKWQVDTWRVGAAALQVCLLNLYDLSAMFSLYSNSLRTQVLRTENNYVLLFDLEHFFLSGLEVLFGNLFQVKVEIHVFTNG